MLGSLATRLAVIATRGRPSGLAAVQTHVDLNWPKLLHKLLVGQEYRALDRSGLERAAFLRNGMASPSSLIP